MSSRLIGGQNLFNSLPRQLYCLGLFASKGRIHPVFPNRPRQNSQRGKELNKFCPPIGRDDLCLVFELYPSSTGLIVLWMSGSKYVLFTSLCWWRSLRGQCHEIFYPFFNWPKKFLKNKNNDFGQNIGLCGNAIFQLCNRISSQKRIDCETVQIRVFEIENGFKHKQNLVTMSI